MKNIIILLIVCILFITTACEKECKTYTQYETAPVILEYFGNYKPGNYWIYENQDGTKIDSMWVSDYVEKNGGDELKCFQYPVREFVLNSIYLSNKNTINIKMSNLSERNFETSFIGTDTNGVDKRLIYATGIGNDSIELHTIKKDYVIKSLIIKKAAIFNNSPFYIFGSKIGIVTYPSQNKLDTFYLTKYFIK